MEPVSARGPDGIRPPRYDRGASGRTIGAALLCGAHLCAVLAAGVRPASGQDDPGTEIQRVVASSDTAYSYALYLPPGHDPGRRWPALVLMDPRGRALVPLERFRDAAAAYGFVLISSYDTSSDEPTSGVATQTAVEVLLNETLDRLGLDPRRLYLAGFSGTARVGWTLAARNPDVIAGVAAFGAGTATAAALLGRAYGHPISAGAYFGGAGLEDFNFAEVRATDRRLAEEEQFAAVRFYAGGHAWPPAGVARETLEWFALHGQRTGRAPRDSAWVAGRYDVWLDRADGLEREGKRYEAWRAYTRTARAFDGLLDTSEAKRAVERLEDDETVVRDRRSLDRWLAWEAEARDRVANGIALLDRPEPPSLETLVRTVGLREIRHVAASGDTSAVHAAARVRAHLLVLAGFYRFRAFVESGRLDRAIRALELAQRADPRWPALCLRFSRLPVSERRKSTRLQDACPGVREGSGRMSDRPGPSDSEEGRPGSLGLLEELELVVLRELPGLLDCHARGHVPVHAGHHGVRRGQLAVPLEQDGVVPGPFRVRCGPDPDLLALAFDDQGAEAFLHGGVGALHRFLHSVSMVLPSTIYR